MLDLYIFPLHRVIDPLQPELPGFLVVSPEKAGARGREGDLLILYLSPDRPEAFTTLAQKTMLQAAVEMYRKSHGTVTNGLRLVADHLNGILLERNLRGPSASEPVTALLNLVSIRDDVLYIAQSGPTHSLFVNSALVQDYSDPLTSGRGLGSTSALNVKYYQVEAKAGDVFVMAPKPPEAWTMEALAGSNLLTLEHLRKRLLNQADPDLQAVVVKFQTGPGQIHVLRPRQAQTITPAPQTAAAPVAASEAAAPAPVTLPAAAEAQASPTASVPAQATSTAAPEAQPVPAAPIPAPATQHPTSAPVEPVSPPVTEATSTPQPASQQPAAPPVTPPAIDTTKPLTRFERLRLERQRAAGGSGGAGAAPAGGTESTQTGSPEAVQASEQSATPAGTLAPSGNGSSAESTGAGTTIEPPIPAPARPDARQARRVAAHRPSVGRKRLAGAWLAWKSFWQKLGSGLKKFTVRLFPVKANQAPTMSPAAMLFIAIAVPLVVVAVAVTFYLQTGRADQRNAFLKQAVDFANAAASQTDPDLQRNDWAQATDWLNKAEAIGVTADSQALRQTIETALDQAEGIIRLNFTPLLRTDLPTTVQITRMAASSSDIYLLDSSQGQILRLFLTGAGYDQDKQFKCGPGANADAPQVGPLVDMAILPPNTQRATVMGMDANGVLLYCIPGQAAVSKALVAPDAGWGMPSALSFSSDTLLVLDVPNNAVWLYSGKDATFTNPPALFFDKDTPSLSDVIDLSFYGDNLYLLRKGGEITLCTLSNVAFAPNRCKDPATYGDTRPNRQPAPDHFSDATFTQVLTTQPPDPSLYLLDTQGPGVYHFSLLMNFQRQIRASGTGDVHPPLTPPTAFTVSPTRQVVLAYGNQVYYSLLP